MDILEDKNDVQTIRLGTKIGLGIEELYVMLDRNQVRLIRSSSSSECDEGFFHFQPKEADAFVEAYTQYRKKIEEQDNAYLEEAYGLALRCDIPIERDEYGGDYWWIDKNVRQIRAYTAGQLLGHIRSIVKEDEDEDSHPF